MAKYVITDWCRECQQCARNLVCPLPKSREWFTHLTAMIDRLAYWVEVIPPLYFTIAEACAMAFVEGSVTRF
jgi:hypothetical protein